MKAVWVLCVILIVAGWSAPPPARADYHYASHDGSNEYPYTSWATAADSIQDAVDAAEPGDTVYVGEGSWVGHVDVYTNSLAIIGMGIGVTLFENYHDEDCAICINSDTVLVEGFSFYADYQFHLNRGIASIYPGRIIVKNNYFEGEYIAIDGNLSGHIYNNYFYNNQSLVGSFTINDELIFENNTQSFHHGGPPLFIGDWSSDNSKFYVRNNLFLNMENQSNIFGNFGFVNDSIFIHNNIIARRIGAGIGRYGRVWTKNHILAYNNTINGTHPWSPYYELAGLQVYITDTTRTIDNNIVVNCDLGVYNYWNTEPVRIRYSGFYNVDELAFGPVAFEESNIYTDPMFVDTLDFYLQAFSPAIDAGDPDIFDIDGTRSDMGAYGGPFGQSYEYLDLPPTIPDSLNAEVSAGLDTIYLNWLYNTESDFNRYQVHRDTVSGFEPNLFNTIAEPDTSHYIDTDFDLTHSYYYRIAAIDNQDNISDYSEQVGVIFTGFEDHFDPNLPRSTVLYQNYPNPFNQQTVIKYYLPNIGAQPAEVKLEIYDILGRAVRILVDESQYPGEHQVNWGGKNEMGDDLPSGVYFYRLFVSKYEFAKPRKLLLMR